jgi:hypothetical protein
VAAHVLYGALVGIAIAVAFLAAQWWQAHQGSVGDAAASAEAGSGAGDLIADVLSRALSGVEFGLLVVFVFFCFRTVLRKDWIASAAAAIVFTLAEHDVWQSQSLLNFVFFLAIFTLLVFVLLRLGLVATIVSIFFVNVLLRTPAPQTLTKPYEWAVVAYPLVTLAVVVWAFWRTSGRQLLAASTEEK